MSRWHRFTVKASLQIAVWMLAGLSGTGAAYGQAAPLETVVLPTSSADPISVSASASASAPAMLAAPSLAAPLAAGARDRVEMEFRLSRDSDTFAEQFGAVSWRGAAGRGLRVGRVQFSAPGWARDGSALLGTYAAQASGHEVDLSLGMVRLASHTHSVGHLDYLRRVRPATAVGLSLERQYVDSQRGIETGTTFDHAAVVLEHQMLPGLDVGGSWGTARFTNDNTRHQMRTRWSYELSEAAGLYLYLKTRHATNSQPGRPEYFSPERLAETSVGLAHKKRLPSGVLVSVEADQGTQRADSAERPLWSLAGAIASSRQALVGWRVALKWTNSASSASAGARYGFSSLSAHLLWAL